jgi:hypothetical protein
MKYLGRIPWLEDWDVEVIQQEFLRKISSVSRLALFHDVLKESVFYE